MEDLSSSLVQRQNILNNKFALQRIQEYIGITGIFYDNEFKFTKEMVANFFEVDLRTIERYLEQYELELRNNGYILSKGNQLKNIILQFAPDINVGSKTRQLGLFNFRSLLNLAMLLKESEKAGQLRSKILDIVIDTINNRTGGGTKYINRRDADYLPTAIRESNYRRDFTSALNQYVEMGNYKYALYTDKIYESIFKENAKEYKDILKMKANENARDTMYSEILNLIASFEAGLAYEIQGKSESVGRKLFPSEVDELFVKFATHPLQRPHIEDARIKMASRDLHFREAVHHKLQEYVHAVSPADFERFIGEQSVNYELELEEAKEVFERLKNCK